LRNPGIVDKVRIGAMPAVEGDIAHSFALMREDGMAVRAVRAEGFLIDVDRPWHLLEANRLAGQHHFAELEGRRIAGGADVSDAAHIAEGAKLDLAPGARIGAGCHIRGALRLGPGSVVENGAIVGGGCYVGASTTIKDYCSVSGGSVLGDRALVQHCAEFGGVLMDTVYLYHYCCVTGLIGLNVDIGAATVCGTWRFDDGTRGQPVKGRTEYPAHWGDGAFIGDYVRTGVNAMFMPGVKVGWHSCVGPGVIVREDVPERTLLLAKQEQIQRPWGPEQYGW
jgi:bifunctional UDP-N-acetylglucosamine pyrophosphorylase/glucosamine-1-phosphate N-acetyltransferase